MRSHAIAIGSWNHAFVSTRDSLRVCLFIRDAELRKWLTDELLLISAFDVHLDPVASLDGAKPHDVVIVDRGAADELRGRSHRAPVIAIGADLPGACSLDIGLTSRDLKQALRELAERSSRAQSA